MMLFLVGEAGLEPAHLAILDPKSSASANSATRPLKTAHMANITPCAWFFTVGSRLTMKQRGGRLNTRAPRQKRYYSIKIGRP